MSRQPIQYDYCEDALSAVQAELLEALLQPEEAVYPWNPAEPEAEIYFAELEQGFSLLDWQENEEIESASQALFDRLHQCWTPAIEVEEALRTSLSERFAAVMPQAWIEAIAHKAQQLFSTNLSLADQLVLCVKPLLPSWTDDDLSVLARPLAFAMRGSSDRPSEAIPSTIRGTDWTELSQMEKVRLSLAAAHAALVQLQHSAADSEKS